MKFKLTTIERKIIKTEEEIDLNPFIGTKFVYLSTSNRHNYSYKVYVYNFNTGKSNSLKLEIIVLDRYNFSKKLFQIDLYLSELNISKEKEGYFVTHDSYGDHYLLLSAIINNDFSEFTELTKEEFLKDIQNTFKI